MTTIRLPFFLVEEDDNQPEYVRGKILSSYLVITAKKVKGDDNLLESAKSFTESGVKACSCLAIRYCSKLGDF